MRKTLIILVLAAGSLLAQSKVGSTAAPFLNIAVGPRAIAMGGAFAATASDVTSLYWNPAGASRMESNSALFSDLIKILDELKAININCVVFQIRTECDALYASKLRPMVLLVNWISRNRSKPVFRPA